MEPNKVTFAKRFVVKYYKKAKGLQKPEESIISILKGNGLSSMKVLDIGIGGGRTTEHIAPIAGSYVGVDYMQEMIDVCNRKFSQKLKNTSFHVADARDLSLFKDDEFDFIIFSFNGIDCIKYAERQLVFNHIKRILKINGFFCYSSHNLLSVGSLFKTSATLNIPYMFKRHFMNQKLKKINAQALKNSATSDYLELVDGCHDLEGVFSYTRPSSEIKILKQNGFDHIRAFDLSGKEMTLENVDHNTERWIYFLCNLSRK
jgi:ubiquinone/menaquinone biosynthesis C-methylase UbiE